MLFALVRSAALSAIGVTFPWNLDAPPGVAQIVSVLAGHRISNEVPHTSSNSARYDALVSRHAMQAVSGKPISWVSTGGPCACSASGLCSLYPVARPSQKFPPKNVPCVALNSNTGNLGEYVYRCAVRLPARK